MIRVVIIVGSTRQHRLADRVLKWVHQEAQNMQNWDVQVVDLKEYKLPIYNNETLPAAMSGTYADVHVTQWSRAVKQADAFLFLAPEYNHGIPAPLKNAIDWLYEEWADKPAGIIGYSSSPIGGARAIEHLRNILATVAVPTVKTGLTIGRAQDIITESGECKDETLQNVLHTEFAQLDAWGKAMLHLHKEM
jgi:NAD(P)H-dependent FMN reductase